MISLPTHETLQRRVQQSLSDEQVAHFQRDGAMCIRPNEVGAETRSRPAGASARPATFASAARDAARMAATSS